MPIHASIFCIGWRKPPFSSWPSVVWELLSFQPQEEDCENSWNDHWDLSIHHRHHKSLSHPYKNASHPSHGLFALQPSGRRNRTISATTSRLCNSSSLRQSNHLTPCCLTMLIWASQTPKPVWLNATLYCTLQSCIRHLMLQYYQMFTVYSSCLVYLLSCEFIVLFCVFIGLHSSHNVV